MANPAEVRNALEKLLNEQIPPIARRYGHEAHALGFKTAWKPIVLIIGNYSSGKSTLINEMVGAPIQRTGQAPTDDCFTILTGPNDAAAYDKPIEVLEELPGSTVVNDPAMPFTSFKGFGSRFISHVQLKRINSPRLRNLALIDSPGMLDSVAELDRGYDYQQVLGRFAELADLVVLVFDPHRAGTIKETYVSIRTTLPQATSEDRVVFVMNRVDECHNIFDLVRCYGVLCWNLSQMTGRKDIPRVYLTFSPRFGNVDGVFNDLKPEREELIAKIDQAPKLQLSHWLGSVDHHLHSLEVLTRMLAGAAARYQRDLFGYAQWAVVSALTAAVGVDALAALFFGVGKDSLLARLFTGRLHIMSFLVPAAVAAVASWGFWAYYRRYWYPRYLERLKTDLDQAAALNTRYERDIWEQVRGKALGMLDDPKNLRPPTPHAGFHAKLVKLMREDLATLYEKHLGQGARPAEHNVG